MRPVLWVGFAILVALAVTAPLVYSRHAQDVPRFATVDEVKAVLKRSIEDERMRVHGAMSRGKVEEFEVLSFKALSRPYLAALLTDAGCPDFLAEPREDGAPWARRVLFNALVGAVGSPGAGRCELVFIDYLAGLMGFSDDIRRAIAVHRIHTTLTKEELVRLRISAAVYGPGILGAPAAARAYLNRDFASLDLAEAVELYIAELDPVLVGSCKNAPQIRLVRDQILDALVDVGAAPAADVKRAKGRAVACLR